jgi:hypothetical protein
VGYDDDGDGHCARCAEDEKPAGRIPFGQEKRFGSSNHFRPGDKCHDCAVDLGEIHDEGCDWEECAECGSQRIGCGCADKEGEDEPVEVDLRKYFALPAEQSTCGTCRKPVVLLSSKDPSIGGQRAFFMCPNGGLAVVGRGVIMPCPGDKG